MKNSRIVELVTALMALCQSVLGQGFVDLNFEQTTIAPLPTGSFIVGANPLQAFPGWTVGGSSTVIIYNNLSTGAPAVDLIGPDFPNFAGYTPLEGSYSVVLQYFGSPSPPTLSQTGLVPAGAASINFLVGRGETDAVVTINGANIPLVPISGGRLAGDISSFAGTVAQLTFSTTGRPGGTGNWLYFDDVQFSASVVPEPSALSLFGIGILLVGGQIMRHSNRTQRAPR